MLKELLVLEADPELFLNKTLDDIEFIDNTLNLLLTELTNNDKLIERGELLSHLSELEWQFSLILSEFRKGGKLLPVSSAPSINEKVTIYHARSLERQKTAEKSGSTAVSGGGSKAHEPVVSSNEMNELLKGY